MLPYPNCKSKKYIEKVKKFKQNHNDSILVSCKERLAAVTWEGSKINMHYTYCCHVCPQGLSAFLPLITKGDRLEITGPLK